MSGLGRIEHVTAGLVEERRKDREENCQIWRDTQRQINELSVRLNDLTLKVADTNGAVTRLAAETRTAHEQFRAADQKPG